MWFSSPSFTPTIHRFGLFIMSHISWMFCTWIYLGLTFSLTDLSISFLPCMGDLRFCLLYLFIHWWGWPLSLLSDFLNFLFLGLFQFNFSLEVLFLSLISLSSLESFCLFFHSVVWAFIVFIKAVIHSLLRISIAIFSYFSWDSSKLISSRPVTVSCWKTHITLVIQVCVFVLGSRHLQLWCLRCFLV